MLGKPRGLSRLAQLDLDNPRLHVLIVRTKTHVKVLRELDMLWEAVVVDRRDGYTPPVGPDSLDLDVVGHHFRDNVINSILLYVSNISYWPIVVSRTFCI